MSIYVFGVALIIAIAFSIAIYLTTVLGLLVYRFCFCGTQNSAECSVSTVKYAGEAGGRAECVVCLTGFEEGESVKQLQQCKHLFHSSCIDMWLYSHSECPICQSLVIGQTSPGTCAVPSERFYPNHPSTS
ncbi:RING-H2 finger protein ATL79-like [Rhodamnia argentea]|uniref:RING-type E3 ubiquitin transferase n=1 Tax=Rhodamnia argentea TaxID=178133 RepID=A0ABM3GYQ5_9MYRT|nr:RING-H2 finger protein ATL79-like [Rhodamnia argentea]